MGRCISIRLSHLCNGRMHQEQLSLSLSWKYRHRVRNGSKEGCTSRQQREAFHKITAKRNVLWGQHAAARSARSRRLVINNQLINQAKIMVCNVCKHWQSLSNVKKRLWMKQTSQDTLGMRVKQQKEPYLHLWDFWCYFHYFLFCAPTSVGKEKHQSEFPLAHLNEREIRALLLNPASPQVKLCSQEEQSASLLQEQAESPDSDAGVWSLSCVRKQISWWRHSHQFSS